MNTDHPLPTRDPMPMLDHLVQLPSLTASRLPHRVRTLSKLLALAFLLLLVGLVFLPWQQNVRGSGRVIAFNPLERRITLEAPLSGRIRHSHVVEGSRVREGQLLFELADNDPALLENLLQSLNWAEQGRDAAQQRVASLSTQITQQESALPRALEAGRLELEAAQAIYATADLQYERIRALFEDDRGLASKRDFELARLERDRSKAAAARAEANLIRLEAELNGSLEGYRASLQSARSDLARAESSLLSLNIEINQTRTQQIVAPRNGIVLRILANEGSFLKSGSPVAILVPETESRMVELWMKGNDVPLVRSRKTSPEGIIIERGSPARIQFEGWPAVQFIGWPSVARGTFAGEVVFIDPTDDGTGRFRVVIAPKEQLPSTDLSDNSGLLWPNPSILRQGVLAQGWVLLDRVPLWFEVWRQLNGFPPARQTGLPDLYIQQEAK
jgi:multidrug resistance efflux pump